MEAVENEQKEGVNNERCFVWANLGLWYCKPKTYLNSRDKAEGDTLTSVEVSIDKCH